MGLDILFLGRLFPREKEAEIKAKMRTGMQDAANALQWNILDGFEANTCGKLKILNYLPVDSYPRGYSDKKIEGFVFQHTAKYKADDLNVGCNNLRIVKHFVNLPAFKRELKKWVTQDNGMKKVLMAYTANPMFLKLAKYAKKHNPKIDTCCIIADIPEFAAARTYSGLRKIYNDYQVRQTNALYSYIDRFVLLTKQMADRLHITVPFMVLEGIATGNDAVCDDRLAVELKDDKYILYSGTLNYKFGIDVLLDAFSKMKEPDIKLVICGFGEAEEWIREKQEADKRIVYLGRVDRKAVLPLQRGATILVNPRQNNEEFTKYSFPSKNLEYLSSGVPVVAYKLDGIPDEYDDYIFYPKDNSPEELARVLKEVAAMSGEQRREIGAKGQRFVDEEKNYLVQTKHILDFIK